MSETTALTIDRSYQTTETRRPVLHTYTNEIITGHAVQEDPSGVGHAWTPLDLQDFPASIAEEIACWIIEDDPQPGDEMTASNGQHYRLPA